MSSEVKDLKKEIEGSQKDPLPTTMTSVVSLIGEMGEKIRVEAQKNNVMCRFAVNSAGPNRYHIQIWLGEGKPPKEKDFKEA